MNKLLEFDAQIFKYIRGLAGESEFWDNFFLASNRYSIAIFTAVLVWYFFRKRRVFWTGLFSALLARGIFATLIHYLIYRPRPFVLLNEFEALIDTKGLDSSFPSGYAAYFFAIAFAVWLSDKRIGGILILGAMVLSFAQIYAGVHYPLDILGGILAAAVSVILVRRVLKN
jgi:undecaprenyl-diphosphatase